MKPSTIEVGDLQTPRMPKDRARSSLNGELIQRPVSEPVGGQQMLRNGAIAKPMHSEQLSLYILKIKGTLPAPKVRNRDLATTIVDFFRYACLEALRIRYVETPENSRCKILKV